MPQRHRRERQAEGRGLTRNCAEAKAALHRLQAVQESLVLQAEMVEPQPKACVCSA